MPNQNPQEQKENQDQELSECGSEDSINLEIATWKKIVSRYEEPSPVRSTWQLVTTLSLYLITWLLIYLNFKNEGPWYLYLPLIILGVGLLMRIFIIFHDCGHNSFSKSGEVNKWVGFITGTLAFTPFKHWTWEHSVHHATVGDIDRRGIGDVWTLMVDEYLALSRLQRLGYRIWRHPLFLFGFAPSYIFFVRERFPAKNASPAQKRAVMFTNLALLCMLCSGCMIFGSFFYILIQMLIMSVAATLGVWLFYVQHQFEGVYWERHENWEYTSAALDGSSYYKLPKILQWFTGNIGFHHLHHLSTKIPNYYLEACHNSHPAFTKVKELTLLGSLKCMNVRLWDESEKALIGWRRLREIRSEREAALAVG